MVGLFRPAVGRHRRNKRKREGKKEEKATVKSILRDSE